MMRTHTMFQEDDMAISVGDRVPDVTLRTMSAEGPAAVQSTDVLGSGKVVLFAVPGAYTPTCTHHHLPGFEQRADELAANGVDTIASVAVNDPFVMGAWGQAQGTDGKVLMLSDGNGQFAAAMGLEFDGSGFGLGTRSQRYAAIIDDGVVTELMVEPGPGLEASSADAVLDKL